MLRVFIALKMADELKAPLVAMQDALRSTLPKLGATWARPENLHLTLRFLGDVPAESLEALTGALREVATAGQPLELEAAGLGCFPGWQDPRVLWAGIREPLGKLTALQSAVRAATDAFTVEPLEPAFHPHVTLARIKRLPPGDRAALEKFGQDAARHAFGRWQAMQVDLVQSDMDSQGSRYSLLAQLPLGAGQAGV